MRLLVLSDVQGNLPALEAALAHPAARGPDIVLCLGDVASGPRPNEVLERLRSVGARFVRGNMDEVVACPPPVSDLEGDSRRFAELDQWCSARLTQAEKGFLSALPSTLDIALPGSIRLLACHGSPRSNEDVISPSTAAAEVRTAIGETPVDMLLVGHLHAPMLRRIDDLLVVNPGSIGWPKPNRRDRRPTVASFAILDFRGDIGIHFQQVRYPLADLQQDVIASGMPHDEWYLQHWQEA